MTALRKLRVATAGLIAGCALAVAAPVAAFADSPPGTVHAINVCQSATVYEQYNPTEGPHGFAYTIGYGNKVGFRADADNGWAVVFDYGPQRWGFMRKECIGGYNSW